MFTEMALTTRRFALTLAVAGIAAMGSIAIAPAASATVVADAPGTVVQDTNGNGPDQFLILDHGRQPIFFCDEDKSNQHHKHCIDLTGPSRF